LEMRRGKIRRKEKPSGGAPLTLENGALFSPGTKLSRSATELATFLVWVAFLMWTGIDPQLA
jgi:hypothetical protein